MIILVEGFFFAEIKIYKNFYFWEPFWGIWYLMRDEDYLCLFLRER